MHTTTDVHVEHVEVSEHIGEKVVQVRATSDGGQKGFIRSLRLGEVESMKFRIVEEIAFDAPNLMIDLPPFRAWIYISLHAVQLQRAVSRFGGFVGSDDEPSVLVRVENLFAIGRYGDGRNSFEDLLSFACFKFEPMDGEIWRSIFCHHGSFENIKNTLFACGDAFVVFRGDG